MDLATQSWHLGVSSGRGSPLHSLDDMKASRVLACVEFSVASMLTSFAGIAAWNVVVPPTDRWAYLDAWPSLALFLALPLAAAFWISGAALFWNWRYRWSLHALPSVILIADWWFIYGA